MKLSEAIRVGALLRPPTLRRFFGVDLKTGRWCSCALGAAYEGVVGQCVEGSTLDENTVQRELFRQFPMLATVVAYPPMLEPDWEGTVYEVVTALNDSFWWTREQIADWLASIGY